MTATVDDLNMTYMITSKSLTVARIFSFSPSFNSMTLFSIPSSEGILDKSLLGRYKITSLREPFVCALIRYGKRFEPTVPLWPKRATIGAMRMIALRLSVAKDESCSPIKAAMYYRSHLYVTKGGAWVWRLSTSCVRARHGIKGLCNERVRFVSNRNSLQNMADPERKTLLLQFNVLHKANRSLLGSAWWCWFWKEKVRNSKNSYTF